MHIVPSKVFCVQKHITICEYLASCLVLLLVIELWSWLQVYKKIQDCLTFCLSSFIPESKLWQMLEYWHRLRHLFDALDHMKQAQYLLMDKLAVARPTPCGGLHMNLALYPWLFRRFLRTLKRYVSFVIPMYASILDCNPFVCQGFRSTPWQLEIYHFRLRIVSSFCGFPTWKFTTKRLMTCWLQRIGNCKFMRTLRFVLVTIQFFLLAPTV